MRRLKVSDNKRFLIFDDGRPFFYLADTAWELFHRLSESDARHYFSTRAKQGFNVIQAVALAELEGLTVPNAKGDLPLVDNDPARPSEAYFKHVDKLVALAKENGLFMALLPTWGDKVNKKWGVGPEIFTAENAHAYGRFLGKRYKDADVIWVLGGDRPVESDEHLAIWRAMAAGISEGDGGVHLKTYHPMGGSSSADKLHDEPWLDFNMLQSGHGEKVAENYRMIAKDYARVPVKPCLDAEPNYENHPVNWKPELGWFDEYEVRRAAYWAVFSGAMGHTYGCNDIWQMWQPGRAPLGYARTPWREALELPGAKQMVHLKNLILSVPFLTRIPAQHLLIGDNPDGFEHIVASSNIQARPSVDAEVSAAPGSYMTADQERGLAHKAQAGDDTALRQMLGANLRLVTSIAKTLGSLGVPQEELINRGLHGVRHAIQRFDPAKGFRFSTYATHWVRQAMMYPATVCDHGREPAFALVYTPISQPIKLDMNRFHGVEFNTSWFDPMTGAKTKAEPGAMGVFNPPHGGKDWVLVLQGA